VTDDPDAIRPYLEDASAYPGGAAEGVARPDDADEAARLVAALAARGVAFHPQAARSSLTGGAVPIGGVVVSVERMTRVGAVVPHGNRGRVVAGAGVRLSELEGRIAGEGWFFPPIPTYRDAMVGGAVSTNAGGAATFKYGVVRDWVLTVEVVLPNGEILALARGEVVARPGESFRIELAGGEVLEIPVPSYRLPPVKKISAGYFASDPMDLVDLFVGSEGTLGLIVSATLELAPRPAEVVTGLAFVSGTATALALAGSLRDAAVFARRTRDPRGPDVRAIELIDGRGLDILRAHGDGASRRIAIPEGAGAALTFEVEIDETVTRERAASTLAAYLNGGPRPSDGPLVRLFAILDGCGALESLDLATSGDAPRPAAISGLREAVPSRVNEMLAAWRLQDPAVTKVAGDLIVPVEHLPAMVATYERGFAARGLDYAIWGHVSDGNLHPNALCRSAEQVALARDAQLEFACECVARGGAPLSEHGVGRSALKKQILGEFLGDAALAQMRAIKRALDPHGLVAPGVLL
jgi:D-lactate dehydrogenase (cytochrome)